MKQNPIALLLIIFVILLPTAAFSDHIKDHYIAPEDEPASNKQNNVFYTEQEAVEKLFPKADKFDSKKIILNDEQRGRVAKRVGHDLFEASFDVFIAKKGSKILGYAIAGEELGKFRAITSMVAIDPKGKVLDVVVMIYRESHGEDVKRKRFLYQYKGKSIKSPVRINKDIMTITSATISVRSMNRQVRKVISVVHEAFIA